MPTRRYKANSTGNPTLTSIAFLLINVFILWAQAPLGLHIITVNTALLFTYLLLYLIVFWRENYGG